MKNNNKKDILYLFFMLYQKYSYNTPKSIFSINYYILYE
jgi:hypothetical protein